MEPDMRRADRLMNLIRHLRDGDLHRAADIARAMGVSLRTVYRDMETLAKSGVRLKGSAAQATASPPRSPCPR